LSTCSPSTRLYGLIGGDVSKSLSPAIHCTVFRSLGVDAVYLAWSIEPPSLRETVEALRILARGFNVTIPYKQEVISFLDVLSGDAEEIGAVNTVAKRRSRLVGYNTDHLGVRRCLEEKRWSPRSALIIGAGGAARAAAYALASLGAERLIVANRSPERARALVEWANSVLGVEARPVPLAQAAEWAREADTIVNATPLGSASCCPGEAPPVLEALGPGKLVFDMVYNPLETRLLREAKKRGAVAVDGLCMLVWQALEADKIWEGLEPTTSLYTLARRAAEEALGGGNEDRATRLTPPGAAGGEASNLGGDPPSPVGGSWFMLVRLYTVDASFILFCSLLVGASS